MGRHGPPQGCATVSYPSAFEQGRAAPLEVICAYALGDEDDTGGTSNRSRAARPEDRSATAKIGRGRPERRQSTPDT